MRVCDEGPSGCGATKQREELAPLIDPMYSGSQSSVGLKEHLLYWRAKELFLRASETRQCGRPEDRSLPPVFPPL
jgi:hypothetical protein